MAPPVNLQHVATVMDRLDPPQRVRKLSSFSVLECAARVLSTGLAWKDAGDPSTAAYKRFRQWAIRGTLRQAWSLLLSQYSECQLQRNPAWFKDLFIDCTHVKNIRGTDCVGRNPTDRGRLGTKMSVVCDNNMVPLACLYDGSNTSDVSLALPTAASIACPLTNDGRRRCNIVGDKGYVSAPLRQQLRLLKLRLVTDKKKGCKDTKRISKADRLRLTARHKIENTFCRLDKFTRIRSRLETSVASFEAFNTLAFIILTMQKIVG